MLVAQSCPTLASPWTVACQAPLSKEFSTVLEWLAIPFSRGSSCPRDWTQVSGIAGGLFTVWATREAHTKYKPSSKNLVPIDRDMFKVANVKIYFPSGHTWLHSQQMCRKISLLRQFARTGHWILLHFFSESIVLISFFFFILYSGSMLNYSKRFSNIKTMLSSWRKK